MLWPLACGADPARQMLDDATAGDGGNALDAGAMDEPIGAVLVDATTPPDDAQRPPFPACGTQRCPQDPPSARAPCDSPYTFECEYGDDYHSSCNLIAFCDTRRWKINAPLPAPSCPTLHPRPDPACPATYDAVPRDGGTCSPDLLSCEYPEGRCTCGGFWHGRWGCDDPGTACPRPRPHVGCACATEGQQCFYDVCSSSLVCAHGMWVFRPPPTCDP